MSLESLQIRLLPYGPEHWLALIEGVRQFEEQAGYRAAAGLRESVVSDEISPTWLQQLRDSTVADPWAHGFGIIHRDSNSVIGSAGFKGPPDDQGMVEIAYGIVPGHQGHGYATEAAEALVAFAVDRGRVRLIRAHTLPSNPASIRVLTKCGFLLIGEVVDPEDGPVLRWERTVQK